MNEPAAPRPAPRRYTSDRGLDRLVFFTDAISAIAITLLILPLVDLVPDAAADSSGGGFLLEHLPELSSFVISFAVIARLWYAHHQLFEHVDHYDTGLAFLSVLWSLTIVVLPLPTAMTSEFSPEPVVIGFYIGTMALSSLLLTSMAVLVNRRAGLQSAENPVGPRTLGGSAATTLLFGVALLVALLVPGVSYWALLLLLVSGPLGRIITRALSRGPASRSLD
ncbi:MAG: TMEM175 family protein [Naasia sp.]